MSEQPIDESLKTAVAGSYDVVVAGAGPAGIAAALSSARAGARVLLIESNGCLGGVWTAGLLCWILDADKPGIMRELFEKVEKAGAKSERRGSSKAWCYDPEVMKLLLEDLALEAGITVQLHTRVVAAITEGGHLEAILTESISGRQAWKAHTFIDCSGNGDLAQQAGCGFDLGHPETGDLQPASMTMLVTGLQYEAVEPFVGGGKHEPKIRLANAMKQGGIDPSYCMPVMFHIYDDLYGLIPNHQYGVTVDDAANLTRATIEARRECHAVVNALRSLGAPWHHMRVVATTEHLGIREGRRIHGQYTVTVDDMFAGKRHPDAVCEVTFGLDVHNTKRDNYEHSQVNKQKIQPYDIPLRSLVSRDIDNLLMAGRCISGDFFAHSSYRVTGNSVAMGEAAGLEAVRRAG